MIVGGVIDVPVASMFDKLQYLEGHANGLRKAHAPKADGIPG